MIKKVIEITKTTQAKDSVELSWFDMQKPNLSAVTNTGVEFIIKAKFTHLHVGDILVCEDGYKIEVKKPKMPSISWSLVITSPLQKQRMRSEIAISLS